MFRLTWNYGLLWSDRGSVLLRIEVRKVHLNCSNVLVVPDPWKIWAITSQLYKIYHIKFARTGLRGDMKMCGIEIKHQILRYGVGTSLYSLLPHCREVQTLETDSLSCVPTLVIWF
jgi:hypothetical protein